MRHWQNFDNFFDQTRPRLLELGIAAAFLRNRRRGWSPPQETHARAALDEIVSRVDDSRVVLVGHSMGARTAVSAAGHPAVVGVIGLAPWLPAETDAAPLRGKRVSLRVGKNLEVHVSHHEVEDFRSRAEAVAAHTDLTRIGSADHWLRIGRDGWSSYVVSKSREFLDV